MIREFLTWRGFAVQKYGESSLVLLISFHEYVVIIILKGTRRKLYNNL